MGSHVMLQALVGIPEPYLKLSAVCARIVECLLLLLTHCSEHGEPALSEAQRRTVIRFVARQQFRALQASYTTTKHGKLLKMVLKSQNDMEYMLTHDNNAVHLSKCLST